MDPRPNILLITSDQQHFDTLGATNPRIETPALDRLAREGCRFERAYTASPVCSPSRSTILTGMYPSQHGCWNLGVKLAEDVPTLSGALGAAGYATSLIGKAHFQPLAETPEQTSLERWPLFRDLAFWRGFHGPWYGFDHVEVNRNHADELWVGQHYALWMEEKGFTDWREHFENDWPRPAGFTPRYGAWSLPEEFHYSVFVADRTIARIDAAHAEGRPFFAWASFADPHPPYLVPEPWASRYDPDDMVPGTLEDGELERMPAHYRETQKERPDFSPWRETPWANHGFHSHVTPPERQRQNLALYYGMIGLMDREIGRILARLDELGLAESTLVVFSTDHGHFLGQHGLWHKGAFPYEDLIRVPMLARWPGKIAAGGVSGAIQSLVDLAPTFLDAAGLPVPGVMTGVSQLPVWAGEGASVREAALTEFRHQPSALHVRTYVWERHKLTLYRGTADGELFDLEADPGERRNLWDEPAAAGLRADLVRRALDVEMAREPMRFPRIAHA